ncbi:hypothetical protein D3C86_1855640 [compost metagenome]
MAGFAREPFNVSLSNIFTVAPCPLSLSIGPAISLFAFIANVGLALHCGVAGG